jgi:hypothetical protein
MARCLSRAQAVYSAHRVEFPFSQYKVAKSRFAIIPQIPPELQNSF